MTAAHALPAVTTEAGGVPLLLLRFSAALDDRRPDDVGALFTTDAVFSPGYTELHSRDAIVALYADRLSGPNRRTDHVWANVLVEPAGDREANLSATLFSYGVHPTGSQDHVDMKLGRVRARCVRDAAGDWVFAEHRYRRSFAARLPLSTPR